MAAERPEHGQSGGALETYALTADRGDEGVRLDLVLLRYLRGRLAVSRRRLQTAIEDGRVTVNGRPATKTAARVASGDRIEAVLAARRRREPAQAQPLALAILFEDEHLLAVNKAPGMVVHPSYKHAEGTVFNAVLWHLRDAGGRPRLLNRLDKDTSGVVLLSKSRVAHAAIVRAVRAGAVCKEYLAVVEGVPKPASGTIAMKLRRDPQDMRRISTSESDGKESATRYETICARSPVSLVRCELVTGRMHQIRVHLSARGWPIVGDGVYGVVRPPMPPALLFPRQALHAWRVSLAHPTTGTPLVIVAPIPDDMQTLMDSAGLRAPTNDQRPTTLTND